uniref:Uncharacterized protein n=1 Tax=Arundo donax TaxID=35708 RepID=A0A0A9BLD4_ARUDO
MLTLTVCLTCINAMNLNSEKITEWSCPEMHLQNVKWNS